MAHSLDDADIPSCFGSRYQSSFLRFFFDLFRVGTICDCGQKLWGYQSSNQPEKMENTQSAPHTNTTAKIDTKRWPKMNGHEFSPACLSSSMASAKRLVSSSLSGCWSAIGNLKYATAHLVSGM